MTGTEALRYAMYEKHLSQQKVADLAGYLRQTNVSGVLRSNNPRIDNMVRILNACGYDLVMVDREKPGEQIVIEAGEKEG